MPRLQRRPTRRSSGRGRVRSPTSPRCGCAGRGAGWSRRRAAVVHDGVRPRHADHVVPDARCSGPSRPRRAARARGDAGRRPTIPSATPSRGRSSTRSAAARRRSIWTDRYYGTVDATPLFLVLLSELWRWSGDDAIVRELEGAARRALALDRRLRRPRRRRLRRVLAPGDARDRQPELEGLAQLDGLPRRLARARADRAGGGAGLRLRREAARRGACAARVAMTRRRRRGSSARRRRCASASTPRSGCRSAAGTRSVSTPTSGRSTRSRRTWATCSGAGSSRRSAIARRRGAAHVSAPLWSGWGVRTLAADEAAFDPLEYHNGTVWPHDNSLIAFGLARAGRREEARRVVRALLDTAAVLRRAGCPSCSPATSEAATSRRSWCRPRRARRRGRRGRRCCCCARCSSSSRTRTRARCASRARDCPSGRRGSTLDGRARARPALERARRDGTAGVEPA